jgi:hypothetical protein
VSGGVRPQQRPAREGRTTNRGMAIHREEDAMCCSFEDVEGWQDDGEEGLDPAAEGRSPSTEVQEGERKEVLTGESAGRHSCC